MFTTYGILAVSACIEVLCLLSFTYNNIFHNSKQTDKNYIQFIQMENSVHQPCIDFKFKFIIFFQPILYKDSKKIVAELMMPIN